MRVKTFVRRLVLCLAVIAGLFGPGTQRAEASDLMGRSSAMISQEIEGMRAPDVRLVLAAAVATDASLLDTARRQGPATQAGDQFAQRSVYCSSGCSSGCSNGCSSGCSSGCSYGCR